MPFDDDELKGDGSPRGSISSEEEKNPDKAKKRKKRKKKQKDKLQVQEPQKSEKDYTNMSIFGQPGSLDYGVKFHHKEKILEYDFSRTI